MPITIAYSGTTHVRATRSNASGNERFYENKKTAYGATLGELLDNLVEQSLKLAAETSAWVKENMPSNYDFNDDFWMHGISHPDILESYMEVAKKDKGKNMDTGSGGSIKNVKDIVRSNVLHRDISISSALNSLHFAQSGETELPYKAKVPFSSIYELSSFSAMASCGFMGEELDSILEISKKEGRLDAYIASLANIRHFRALESANREKEAAKEAKKKNRKKIWGNN